ncbi:hypothetical protein [Rhodococcus opacus]|nr:hypothetical protein [Rhodococcus opacus]
MKNQRWFGALVQHRREELGLTPIQLHRIGGPSLETLAKIESGEGTVKHTTLVRIDQSLGWPEGASLRILTGTDSVAPPEIYWGRTLTAADTLPEAVDGRGVGHTASADPAFGDEAREVEDPAARAGLIRVRVDFEAFFVDIGIDGVVEAEKALIGWELAAVDEQLATHRETATDQESERAHEQVQALLRRREVLEAELTEVEERYLRDVAAYTAAYAAAVEAEARRLGWTGPVIVECVGAGAGAGVTEADADAADAVRELVERLRRHARTTTPLPGSSYGTARAYSEMERRAADDYRTRLRHNRTQRSVLTSRVIRSSD